MQQSPDIDVEDFDPNEHDNTTGQKRPVSQAHLSAAIGEKPIRKCHLYAIYALTALFATTNGYVIPCANQYYHMLDAQNGWTS